MQREPGAGAAAEGVGGDEQEQGQRLRDGRRHARRDDRLAEEHGGLEDREPDEVAEAAEGAGEDE